MDDAKGGGAAADWRVLQREIFPPSEVNEYRHINVADFSDHTIGTILFVFPPPPSFLTHAVPSSHDAFGNSAIPEDVMMQMGAQQQPAQQLQLQVEQGLGQSVHLGADQLRDANTLQILLQSLLPWVAVDAPAPGQEGDGRDEEA